MNPKLSCQGCRDGANLPFAFTMAFQPILDTSEGRMWGYEALVRGPEGQGAGTVLDQVTPEMRYRFDQACRVRAIELFGQLSPHDDSRLSINFLPNAVYEPAACIRASLSAAARVGLNPKRLMFEFTEQEHFTDTAHISNIVAEYKRQGFMTALDDFGSGYAGLNLLANLQTDLIKIDMDLIRDIHTDCVRQAIVAGIMSIARALDIQVIAEGIESEAELTTLRAAGISLFQGYYFARPQVEALPTVAGFAIRPATQVLRA
ncbi:Blue light- and temperature-regulated antirepressor BluF [Asticcacaulis sp. MM231]|uniref:EAL domain-containing protein n=1 Tax=Asticcacaulis sp. MM231 TaxID=3157666 RepID=UPI0032D5AAD2